MVIIWKFKFVHVDVCTFFVGGTKREAVNYTKIRIFDESHAVKIDVSY